jgi:hypothetical protein
MVPWAVPSAYGKCSEDWTAFVSYKMIAHLLADERGAQMNEPETITTVVAGEASATVAEAAKKPKARSAPKWEPEARDRLKTAIRRYSKPLADLVARDANEGDTRLLVTDFLCDGLGFDKYADLTTEYQVKGEFADYGLRIDRELVASSRSNGSPPSSRPATYARWRCMPSTRASSGSS